MEQDELVTFVEAMDQCWLERRFEDLSIYLAPDIVMVAPSGKRLIGFDAAVESYREFMERCVVNHYKSADHVVTIQAGAAVIEYTWHMDWRDAGQRFMAEGREVLALTPFDDGWRVFWRTQLPA